MPTGTPEEFQGRFLQTALGRPNRNLSTPVYLLGIKDGGAHHLPAVTLAAAMKAAPVPGMASRLAHLLHFQEQRIPVTVQENLGDPLYVAEVPPLCQSVLRLRL